MDPLFGSETRARVLEHLASTPRAQSAYRVARAIGAEPIQVTRILKSLEGPEGLAGHSAEGWVLTNELLRDFLRERLALRQARVRAEKDEFLVQLGSKPSSKYGSDRV